MTAVSPKPLRVISASMSHPAFHPNYHQFEVRADGEIVRDCIFADVKTGQYAYLKASGGMIVPNADNTGPLVTMAQAVVTIARSSLPLTDRYSEEYLTIFAKQHKIVRPN